MGKSFKLADEKTPDKACEAEERQIKDKRGKGILEQIKDEARFMILGGGLMEKMTVSLVELRKK